MHAEMLDKARADGQIARDGLYGLDWGDPQAVLSLQRSRDQFLLPYVNPDHKTIEIGPGAVDGHNTFLASAICMELIGPRNCSMS